MLEGGRTWETWEECLSTPTAPYGYKKNTKIPAWLTLGALVRCPKLDTGRGLGGFRAQGSVYVVERVYARQDGWLMCRVQRIEPPFYVNGNVISIGHLTPARLPKDWAMSIEADEATRFTRGDGVVEEPDALRARVALVSNGTERDQGTK